MASEHHIAILRQGIETWNQWRGTQFNLKPNLIGINLSGRSFCYIDLSYTDMSGGELCDTDLRFANLIEANLSQVNLRYANLNGGNLSGANLRGTNLSGADLSGSNLSDADLCEADLSGADLNGAYLSEVNMSGAYLRYANLSEADISNAVFRNANMSGANLRQADLTKVDFRHANLNEADLSETDLRSAMLVHATLTKIELSRANLQDADFREADLRGANLQDADLCGVNFSGANLSNADLSGANLSGANLSNANLTQANLNNSNLHHVRAAAANFNAANMTGTCLDQWSINNLTSLEDVVCDFFYSKNDQGNFRERRPNSGMFNQREFTALFQKSAQSITLTFKDGINWKAFALTFEKLCQQFEQADLRLQAIEQKRSGMLVVHLELASDLTVSEIEAHAFYLYEAHLNTAEAQYTKKLLSQGNYTPKKIQKLLNLERHRTSSIQGILTVLSQSQDLRLTPNSNDLDTNDSAGRLNNGWRHSFGNF